MRHNNMLTSVHRRKHWQERVKVWFDQPSRHRRRLRNRRQRASKLAPTPTHRLRPAIACPTRRYNYRLREGKGFSVAELKSVGVAQRRAKALGISIDKRRINKSQEALDRNKQRLKDYMSRLTIIPASKSKRAKLGIRKKDLVQHVGKIMPISNKLAPEAPRAVTKEEMKLRAYRTLRNAFRDKKKFGKREKARKDKEEAAANV